MQQDRPVLGILLMLGFCVVAPMGDATAKLLSGVVPLLQLLLVRFAVQFVVLLPALLRHPERLRMAPGIARNLIVRTVLHIIGIGMMFTALRYLPLADAVAIAFVMPFIMLLLGWFYLGEQVGPQRLVACAVGFVGTLLVVQPSFQNVGWPALLPIGVAINFAVFMLITRKIAKALGPVEVQGISGGIAVLVLLPLMLILPQDVPGAGWHAPDARTWFLLLLIGLFGTLGHLLMTASLRYAPSATLAPMQYLEIPFATAIGWIVFSELPNGLAALGIAITMLAGLFIIYREQTMARQQVVRQTPPQAPPAV